MAKTTQPANTPPPAYAFASGGTSQAERLAAALLPEHLQLDEGTLPSGWPTSPFFEAGALL